MLRDNLERILKDMSEKYSIDMQQVAVNYSSDSVWIRGICSLRDKTRYDIDVSIKKYKGENDE